MDKCQRPDCKNKACFTIESNEVSIDICEEHEVWGWCFVQGKLQTPEEVTLPEKQIFGLGTLAIIDIFG